VDKEPFHHRLVARKFDRFRSELEVKRVLRNAIDPDGDLCRNSRDPGISGQKSSPYLHPDARSFVQESHSSVFQSEQVKHLGHFCKRDSNVGHEVYQARLFSLHPQSLAVSHLETKTWSGTKEGSSSGERTLRQEKKARLRIRK
jgi:hypothetical protein